MSKNPSQPIVYSTYLGGQGMTWDGNGYVTGVQGTHAAADFPASHLGRRPVALVQRTFEFRLCGSEMQEQSVPAPGPADGTVVVAVNNIRTYLTGSGDAGVSRSAIGAVEVWAERREGAIVCCARLSDFGVGDLVVVQADVVVYRIDM
jgi:hypothetical protein